MVGDTASGIDERLGEEYGDYARRAAGTIENVANSIAEKDPDELIEDTRNFVRNSPGMALAGAAVVGFVVARLLKWGLARNEDERRLMLKPPGPHPPPEPDRSIGDLIERLLDDALDYGRAESICSRRELANSPMPMSAAAILFAIAAVVGLAGVVTLFVGIAMALARWIGPLGGAIVSTCSRPRWPACWPGSRSAI